MARIENLLQTAFGKAYCRAEKQKGVPQQLLPTYVFEDEMGPLQKRGVDSWVWVSAGTTYQDRNGDPKTHASSNGPFPSDGRRCPSNPGQRP